MVARAPRTVRSKEVSWTPPFPSMGLDRDGYWHNHIKKDNSDQIELRPRRRKNGKLARHGGLMDEAEWLGWEAGEVTFWRE